MAAHPPIVPDTAPASPIVWRLTILVLLAMLALTAADIGTTLIVLKGDAIELNTYARTADGGLHTEFLVLINICILGPLALAFHVGLRHADRVPHDVLAFWWRHLFNFLSAHPSTALYKGRAPLRLVAAALTIVIFKVLVVFSNVLGAFNVVNPATLIGWIFTDAGFDGLPLWRAVYVVMIVPCYVAAVWLASLTLRAVQGEHRVVTTAASHKGPAE